MEKRTEVYLLRPKEFEISGCPVCGNEDPDWSEFKSHLWCARCEKDFIPESSGVFDGPVPINTAHLMGMCFATIDIETGAISNCPADKCDASERYRVTV